jgi:hypothetical protein
MNANAAATAATGTPAAAPETTAIDTPTKDPATKKGAAKKSAKATTPMPASKDTIAPREGSKGSQTLTLLQRKSGATLDELMTSSKVAPLARPIRAIIVCFLEPSRAWAGLLAFFARAFLAGFAAFFAGPS